ncbi:ABC transporter permease [Streptococcus sp. DD12]|uniref:ABC transporter permease n=1 Tax=Streptococcus sp. DD12 TaxID=1777880 RepID=UPI000794864B|nr:ABC transporter permease [Streptococcus sp. DD12]KXT75952.1 hypothetical protein STRDD12_01064 [Streptococcus sp. DD12]
MASLRLSFYKFKNSWTDFVKVLFGILLFEVLIVYIQKKDFLEQFESTRMTTFLLLFSSALLILVQNAIYISKERSVLDRDFFSGLSRTGFAVATLLFNTGYAIIEALVFVFGYHWVANVFDKDLKAKGIVFGAFDSDLFVTVLLVFLSAHFLALVISSLAGTSEISSVILAVVVGIVQFALSGTVLQLPKAINWTEKGIFLGAGHKAFGAINGLREIPSQMAKFGLALPKAQLDQFTAKSSALMDAWQALFWHAVVYALCFVLLLRYKKR